MANDHLWKVAQEAEERVSELAATSHPLGVDVGTSKIVAARRHGKELQTASQLNAFIPVPYSRFTEKTLTQNDISYYRDGDELVIFGTATEHFANMFNAEFRRPMADGILNPKERLAWPVIEAVLQMMIPKARVKDEILAFSVPAVSDGREPALTYHEATFRGYFESLGYKAIAINEGLAVVFAELESENFTGIGVSCGGGMCNVALSFLSIPSILFSISKGGDFIDQAVGQVVNEHGTRVKMMKEESLDLSRAPKDKLEKALHIYYSDLVEELVRSLKRALSKAEKLPKIDRALPIVLSGGSAKPKGFRDLFEKTLKTEPLPIEISEVRLASEPLTATARGALIAAMYER